MNLLEPIADFLRCYHLTGMAGIVAVSGGPDSVALAHGLTRLLREGLIERLVLAHVNHRLRGAESDADEQFMIELAERWYAEAAPAPTLQFIRIDTLEEAREQGENLEAYARERRYSWLVDLARQEGAAWVATGHTADDQAETVLFRLLRGSGLDGLAGMRPLRPLAAGIELIRPCLSLRRQQLADYLAEQGLPARQDSSNLDPRFTRNRLRHELIPLLQRDYNPALIEVLNRLAEQADSAQQELTRLAAELLTQAELPRAGQTLVLQSATLADRSPHLVREMFRLLWQREGWSMGAMGYDDWQRLAELAAGRLTAWDFPGRIHARQAGRVVQVTAG